jgi:hypothetical protein
MLRRIRANPQLRGLAWLLCPAPYSLILLLVGLPTLPKRVQAAEDLRKLPANTWVPLKVVTQQPAAAAGDKGRWMPQSWNKLVYDPDDKAVLFYDRWYDKDHGGYTIYGNCLFHLDPQAGTLTPISFDHWTKIDVKGGGYRTVPLPANAQAPTPCPRHVYHAFDYVPGRKSVFLCNGANQSAMREGKLLGHDLCADTWEFRLATKKWVRLPAGKQPPNLLDDAMCYCPATESLIYAGHGKLWLLHVGGGTWRRAKHDPPTGGMGQTAFYDARRQRVLLAGGGPLDAWRTRPETFRRLYAFDPRTESIKRLADCPTVLYASHLAHDTRRDLFFIAAVFKKGEQSSGLFAYDPKKDAWRLVQQASALPPPVNWFVWMRLCYDAEHDCLIGLVGDRFYAFRYGPGP